MKKDIMQQTRHIQKVDGTRYEVHIRKGWFFREQLKATLMIGEKCLGYQILSKCHQREESLIMQPYSAMKSITVSSNKLTIKFYLEAKDQATWVFYAENQHKARSIERLIEEQKTNLLRGQQTVIHKPNTDRENQKPKPTMDKCDISKSEKQSLFEYLDLFDTRLNNLTQRLKIEVQFEEQNLPDEIVIASTNLLRNATLITNPALQLKNIESERKRILMKLQNISCI